MSSRHIPVSDGVSRFLSMFALVAAIGSAVFLYQENQKLRADLETLKSSDKFVQYANEWDKSLTGALEEFKTRANKSLDGLEAERIARKDVFDPANASMLTRADVEDIVSQHIVAKPMLTPNLRIQQTAMKPLDGSAAPVMIANDGGIHAEIVAARFVPALQSQFKTDLPAVPHADQIVVRFSPSHNNPTKANHHRMYERRYLVPEQAIAPDSTAKVSVEIANNKHVDWGMKGKLELEYQDGRTLTIPSVEAIFVPEKVETT